LKRFTKRRYVRKALIITGQIILFALIGWFVWRAIQTDVDNLGEIDFDFEIHWGWALAALGAVIGTYAVLIQAWLTILLGWEQRLAYRRAARIWTISNLGRYIPGKIWTIAGLAVLAAREGVAGWAAGASAIVMQFIALATGVAVFAATGSIAGIETPIHASVLWIVAFVSVGVVAFLATNDALGRASRIIKPGIEVRALSPRAAVLAVVTTAVSWCTYGVALWMLARGIGVEGLTLSAAISAFTASYIMGLLIVFAPGGIGIREASIVALLTPSLGVGAALTLAVVARVLMTVAEIVAAGIATISAGEGMLKTT
jgi:hypothetical protein